MNRYYQEYLEYKISQQKISGGAQKHQCKVASPEIEKFLELLDQDQLNEKIVQRIDSFFKLQVKKCYDPEYMHMLEDSLMRCFIRMVAKGDKMNTPALAEMIRTINDANYMKWYS